MTGDGIVAEVLDRRGRRVVLLRRVWHGKVLTDHPEMAMFRGAVLAAVSDPSHVEADPVRPDRERCFARGVGISNWLQVVVSYEQDPARIVSAFAKRKDPPTWRT